MEKSEQGRRDRPSVSRGELVPIPGAAHEYHSRVKLVPDMFSVGDLVTRIDDGAVAIPEFQRHFVWRPPQVADLLVSVARRWPIGSLLLLEGPQDFGVRPLDGAPELSRAELLILDGQQRLTALYHALGDRSSD